MIYLRQAVEADVTAIMTVIEEARAFLGRSGSDQWQRAYPAVSDVTADIALRQGYVLVVDGATAGYAAVITGCDPHYTAIRDGSWLTDATDYVAVHRIALSDRFRGHQLTRYLFSDIFTMMAARGYSDFRVDTHALNPTMQHVFEREGFERRGTVLFEGPRIAYQRLLTAPPIPYERQFMQDFSDWTKTQVALMAKAQELATAENQRDAAIRYESRLDAYHFLQTKFANYQAGKGFHDLPDHLPAAKED